VVCRVADGRRRWSPVKWSPPRRALHGPLACVVANLPYHQNLATTKKNRYIRMQTRKPPHMHKQREGASTGSVRGSAHLVREPLEAFSNAITCIPPRSNHLPRAVQRVEAEREFDVLAWGEVAVTEEGGEVVVTEGGGEVAVTEGGGGVVLVAVQWQQRQKSGNGGGAQRWF